MLPKGLLKEYSQILSLVLRALDVSAVVAAGYLAYIFKFEDFNLNHLYMSAIGLGALMTLFVFPFFRIYESVRAKKIWRHLFNIMQAVAALLILLSGFAFISKTGDSFSRL